MAAASQVCYFSCLQLAHHNSLPHTLRSPTRSPLWPTPLTLPLTYPWQHIHTPPARLELLLVSVARRLVLSVLLRACCLVAFTTTTNTTTICHYTPIFCSPLSLCLSLSALSVSAPAPAVAHSFIHLFILLSQPHAHFAHSARPHIILVATLHCSLCLSLSISWLLLGVVFIVFVASCARFYSFCAHAIH